MIYILRNMKRVFVLLALVCLLVAGASAQNSKGNKKKSYKSQLDGRKVTVVDIQERELLPFLEYWMQSTPKEVLSYSLVESGDYNHTALVHSQTHDSLLYFPHPLIEGVRYAYTYHRPFVLSPDALWLVIANGFAVHVDHHADSLRPSMVKFDSVETLKVLCKPGTLHMPAENWEPYFPQFTQQMKQYVDPALVDNLTCDFSTTTPASYTASQISIMAAMKSYFSYEIIEACGIPKVYIEGTPKDWKRLVKKANGLRRYGLDWWIDELEPVLRKIAAAAGGEVDVNFWKSIYSDFKPQSDEEDEGFCGLDPNPPKIDGWIVKFYPYDSEGNRTNLKGLDENDIRELPVEVSSCPLIYQELGGSVHNLVLQAGLMAVWLDPVTQALRPEIIWSVSASDKEGL